MNDKKITIGLALTGSFCTFEKVIGILKELIKTYNIIPIMSFNASRLSTRFGKAEDFIGRIEEICGNKVICTIEGAEPIGPKNMVDVLVVAPCTGNTMTKLAWGIIDTPVTLAVKSHLRNLKPVVIAASTNDGLSSSAKNIGLLLNYKNYYFVPLKQDDPIEKPFSLSADFDKIPQAIEYALQGKQLQPIFY